MVLVALMSGGDYSKGTPGCGFSISSALARCGFGDSLLHAFNNMVPKDLEAYIEQWCKDLRDELRSNSMGNLHSKQVNLANQIPLNFIDRNILELYLKPYTSSTGPNITYNPADWRSRELSIWKIANFCSQKFGWKTTEALAQNMKNNLWEGVFFRMLASVRVGFTSSVSCLIFL
jgi:Holliday junction resolvase YEN1